MVFFSQQAAQQLPAGNPAQLCRVELQGGNRGLAGLQQIVIGQGGKLRLSRDGDPPGNERVKYPQADTVIHGKEAANALSQKRLYRLVTACFGIQIDLHHHVFLGETQVFHGLVESGQTALVDDVTHIIAQQRNLPASFTQKD